MVEIYYGRAGTGKKELLFDKMRAFSDDGKKTVLIVPEQLSITRENDIHSRGITGVSVLSFTRFANTVFRSLGGTAKKHPDKAMAAAAVFYAVERVYDRLTYFKNTAFTVGFITALMSAFSEFDDGCMTAAQLDTIPQDELSGTTRAKYRDMFLIYDEYKSLWTGEYKDPASDITDAAALLELSDLFSDTVFVFDGFFGFTEQQLLLISQIITRAPLSVFAFTTDMKSDLFASVTNEVKKLTRLCKKQDVGFTLCELTSQHGFAPAIANMEKYAFDAVPKKGGGDEGGVSIYCAGNINEELGYIACRIKNDVLHGKYRYGDIAVLCPDADSVRFIAASVFEKHGIPAFTDTSRTMRESPLCAFVTTAFDIAKGGATAENMFSFLKTGLCGIPFDDISLLESYVRMWKIRDSGWKCEWTRSPFGIGGFEKDEQEEKERLCKLNELRTRVTAPLDAFRAALHRSKTCTQLLTAVYRLTEDFSVRDNLSALALDFKEAGKISLYEEYMRVYGVFVDMLDSIHIAVGEKSADVRRFYDMFSVCASAVTLPGRPSRTDEVLFAATGRARAEGKKCVYIARMNSAYIPALKKQSALITDADKRVFERHGITLSLGAQMSAYREHFDFYYAAMSPTDELVLTYSAFSPTGDSLPVSEYLEAVQTATGVPTLRRDGLDPDFFLVSVAGAADEAARTGDTALYQAVERASGISLYREKGDDKLSDSVVEGLYSRNLRLSFSGMEEYVYCPFKFFMDRGLRAKAGQPVEFNAADIGTFIHKGLEDMLSGDYDISTELAVKTAIDGISDSYESEALADLKGVSKRFDYMFSRAKEALHTAAQNVAAEIRESEFKPFDFEVDISKYAEPAELQNGYTLTLVGSIDRVDMTEDGYAKVVDYKSGRQAFSFKNIYNGLTMQLPVYASAIKAKDKDIKIAAMYYLKVGVPEVPGVGTQPMDDDTYRENLSKYYKRDGIFSTDGQITDRLQSRFLHPAKDRLLTENGINRLIDFTAGRIREVGIGITSGNTDVSPLTDNACRYCDYKSACGIGDREECRRELIEPPDDFLKEDE